MELTLNEEVKNSAGQVFATMSVTLTGDGSTPNVMTEQFRQYIGFDDFGNPMYPEVDADILADEQKKFMANAIAVQKSLTQANGINPDVVNVIGAELGGNNDAKNN